MTESERVGLVARLLEARDDPIDVIEHTDYGTVRHDVIGVLPEDLELILSALSGAAVFQPMEALTP